MARCNYVIGYGSPFGYVDTLDAVIRDSIKIPEELRDNLEIKSTELGGVILEYYSFNDSKLYRNSSKVQFTLYFDTGSALGLYDDNNIVLKIVNYKGVKLLHCSDTRRPYHKIVNKVNKWIESNKEYLINSIEH